MAFLGAVIETGKGLSKFVIPAAGLGLLGVILIRVKNSHIKLSLPKLKLPTVKFPKLVMKAPSTSAPVVKSRRGYRRKEKLNLQHLEQLHHPSLFEAFSLTASKISGRKAF